MSDFEKFKIALNKYLPLSDNNEKGEVAYEEFYLSIKNLECNDFRFYFHLAYYQNSHGYIDKAKNNINYCMSLLPLIHKNITLPSFNDENCIKLFITKEGRRCTIESLPELDLQLAQIYECAGEIYAKMQDYQQSLEYYKRHQYFLFFRESKYLDFYTDSVFSFRKYNEYSLADLINDTITVAPSYKMNDPFDSIINLWASVDNLENICEEKEHIMPYHQSFDYYRIRSFCSGVNNAAIENVLMWSHYAGEHTGFCIRYKLSRHFIKQEKSENYVHMYLKEIQYTDEKISLNTNSIDSNIAFATKKKDWEYEHEVRLIVYDPTKIQDFYGIPLDDDSSIEGIYFGYRCSEQNINTIKNIFKQRKMECPNFYKMEIDQEDVYKMKCREI